MKCYASVFLSQGCLAIPRARREIECSNNVKKISSRRVVHSEKEIFHRAVFMIENILQKSDVHLQLWSVRWKVGPAAEDGRASLSARMRLLYQCKWSRIGEIQHSRSEVLVDSGRSRALSLRPMASVLRPYYFVFCLVQYSQIRIWRVYSLIRFPGPEVDY